MSGARWWMVVGVVGAALPAGPVGVFGSCPALRPGLVGVEKQIAAYVARMEGWGRRGSLVRRLNNPGALVYIGRPGTTRDRVRVEGQLPLARYESVEKGWEDLRWRVRVGLEEGTLRRAWRYLGE